MNRKLRILGVIACRAASCFAVCLAIGPTAARAAEIKFAPADSVLVNRANDQGMFDFVLHTIAVGTGEKETLLLQRLRIDVIKDGETVLTKFVQAERMVSETKGLTSGPERIFLGAQLLTQEGASGVFSRAISPATSSQLAPSQYLLTTRQHFSVDFLPTEVRVTAVGEGGTAVGSLPVRRHESKISYIMPLDGAWKLHSLPMIASHHRLNPPTEFAVDFFKTDDRGVSYVGDPVSATNALGYGAPVKASAAGVVVFVIADDTQDRQAFFPRPGEDAQTTGARIGAFNMQRYAKDLRRGSGGNIVTLKHELDGTVEYSSYGHLKAGSVTVKLGDRVPQGHVIGQVGDTGDSPAVHLHFQINSGPDPFFSKSLPAQFSDMRYLGSSRDPARFVTNEK
ncbi:MAG: M23 family metallopeptidase [Rhodospirillaceae bacterium]